MYVKPVITSQVSIPCVASGIGINKCYCHTYIDIIDYRIIHNHYRHTSDIYKVIVNKKQKVRSEINKDISYNISTP